MMNMPRNDFAWFNLHDRDDHLHVCTRHRSPLQLMSATRGQILLSGPKANEGSGKTKADQPGSMHAFSSDLAHPRRYRVSRMAPRRVDSQSEPQPVKCWPVYSGPFPRLSEPVPNLAAYPTLLARARLTRRTSDSEWQSDLVLSARGG